MGRKYAKVLLILGLSLSPLVILEVRWAAPARPGQGRLLENPYEAQVKEQIGKLKDSSPGVHAGAAESLGYLRAYSVSPALAIALADKDFAVRRNAALSLAWCGGRPSIQPLLAALEDNEWSVSQAGAVALTNLTGMQFTFDALTSVEARRPQIATWRG